MSLDHLTNEELAAAYLALVETAPGQSQEVICNAPLCFVEWKPRKEDKVKPED